MNKNYCLSFIDKSETMVFEDGQLVKQMIEKMTEDTSFVLTDKVILTFKFYYSFLVFLFSFKYHFIYTFLQV